MVTIKENVWIPKLQEISKAVIRKCFECKRFHIKLFSKQQRGILLSDITTGKIFQVIGGDFAGSNHLSLPEKRREKAANTSFDT